jgi:hypothetical protein
MPGDVSQIHIEGSLTSLATFECCCASVDNLGENHLMTKDSESLSAPLFPESFLRIVLKLPSLVRSVSILEAKDGRFT